MKIIEQGLTLETNRVLLRPLQAEDFDAFLELAREDENMWQYFQLNLAYKDHLRKWMDQSLQEKNSGSRRPFTIIDKSSGRIAGSSGLLNISYYDLRLEIGGSWLGKDFRSTGVNMNAKYAMMRFSFDELNFERIEFKTDVLNERAKQGLRKIGGKDEGVFRSHMTMWNNRRRDSIFFSVLRSEWTRLKKTIFRNIEGFAFFYQNS